MKPHSHAIDRRRLVLAASVAGATMAANTMYSTTSALSTPVADLQRAQEHIFVLVHGAWHGGWCWKKVAPLLRAAGYDVLTPTLTGLGERVHLLSPDVDLDTHINDVVGVLEYEDLQNVVLVGHSYGGMVISGSVPRATSRLAQLVYLDAFFPEDGKAVRDYAPAETLDELVVTQGDGWRLPSFMRANDFGVVDPEDAAWVNARLGDQPYGTFTQPVDLGSGSVEGIQRAYILTTQDTFVPHAARAQQEGLEYHEMFAAGHNSMVTMPEALVDLLLTIVRS